MRLENSCFHERALETLAFPPLGSISLLPSGWPAICNLLKPAASNKPDSINWIDESKSPSG